MYISGGFRDLPKIGFAPSVIIVHECVDSTAAISQMDITTPHELSCLGKISHDDAIDGHLHRVRSNCSNKVSELMKEQN